MPSGIHKFKMMLIHQRKEVFFYSALIILLFSHPYTTFLILLKTKEWTGVHSLSVIYISYRIHYTIMFR